MLKVWMLRSVGVEVVGVEDCRCLILWVSELTEIMFFLFIKLKRPKNIQTCAFLIKKILYFLQRFICPKIRLLW